MVSTVIAFVALAVSFWFSRRQLLLQEQQAKDAQKQAEATAAQAAESNREAQAAARRAAASAALTIDDLSRIAGALEQLAAHPGSAGPAHPTGFEARTAVPVVAWSLTPDGPGRFRLANTGTATAHDVWVGGAASLDGPHGIAPGASLAPGAAATFTATVLPTTTDSTLTVTWADTTGSSERRSWRYPLPGV
ncbi:hypothetical protein GCM10025780_32760 [Frondihabitans cladoniiphilus]|uniref:Uncharacterized protein n=1 Tax=Frondihabitans cladoniiphilus TaxID=715785 RepID=A0ABP8W8W5_9MICO